MLTFSENDPHSVTLAVTECGVRIENPAVLPGAKLAAEERATLLDHGWKMHEGLYYHPAGVWSGYFHRLVARSKANKPMPNNKEGG